MKKPELLAPAGSMEAFYAAIEAGCDAVYIGGYSFGARAFSDNFSNEEIVECIKYAHLYGVKVYVTVNTIVYESEVDMFMNYIDFLHRNNVDAIIIQDLGMFDLIRKTYPNLELHASTQMHIHNLGGAQKLEEWGAKRVVLARETNIDLIKEIRSNTNIELEVFVHGALCVSYSGQCLMSSLIGGRSGNRGKCAGTCRQMYNLVDENNKKYGADDYLISMRDLNTLNKIGQLIDIGINSFKIEGRMKRPEYVYLVVSIYRKAIDNYLKYKDTKITEEDFLSLRKIYNRKFTEGYLFNDKNIVNQFRPNHLGINIGKVIKTEKNKIYIKLSDKLSKGDGIRFLNKKEDTGLVITKMFVNNKDVIDASTGDVVLIKEDISCDIGATVIKTTDQKQLKEIEQSLKNKKRKVEITGKIIIKSGSNLELFVRDGINNLTKKSDYIIDSAINRNTTNEEIEKQLNKTNDTVYTFKSLEIINDNKSFIPIFRLNELRRETLNLLNEKRLYNIPYKKEKYYIDVPDFEKCNKLNILIRNKNIYNKIKTYNYENLYLDKELFETINDDKKILKLDRVVEQSEEYNLPCLVSEIGSLKKGCFTDFGFNVTNSYTVSFLHSLGVSRVTLSYELDDNQIKDLIDNYKKRYGKSPNLELIVKGREEAMISKFNLLKELNGKFYLKDKYNNKFPIRTSNNLMTIFNYKVRNYNDLNKYYEMGINYLRYDFLDENDLN